MFFTHPIPDRRDIDQIVQESQKYTNDQLQKEAFFRRRATELMDLLESEKPGRGSLLDVGCAIGTELVVAAERGWQPLGIELSQTARELAVKQGLDVMAEPLERCSLPSASFDVVTLNHVLEHQPEPREFLYEVARVLRPDGKLFVSVPNVQTWLYYIKRDRYSWTFQPDHFLHFSVPTLQLTLRTAGFQPLRCWTSRWSDYHYRPAERGRLGRLLDTIARRHNLGIEVFCLCESRPR